MVHVRNIDKLNKPGLGVGYIPQDYGIPSVLCMQNEDAKSTIMVWTKDETEERLRIPIGF